jgi:hypothetical protein
VVRFSLAVLLARGFYHLLVATMLRRNRPYGTMEAFSLLPEKLHRACVFWTYAHRNIRWMYLSIFILASGLI